MILNDVEGGTDYFKALSKLLISETGETLEDRRQLQEKSDIWDWLKCNFQKINRRIGLAMVGMIAKLVIADTCTGNMALPSGKFVFRRTTLFSHFQNTDGTSYSTQ
jgi:hypothetical protein